MSDRERVVLDHMPIVRTLASRVRARVPASVELDDLVQGGAVGLLDAVTKFDPNSSNEFRTYAKHRIKDAILGTLRELDPADRILRHRQRRVDAATWRLTATLQRHPTELEVAVAVNVKLDLLRKTKARLQQLRFVSKSPGVDATLELPAKPEYEPEHSCARRELRVVLARTISRLPPRHQEIVRLYYTQGLTMEQIGTSLAVTVSRVSQIHSKALARIGQLLEQKGINSARAFL